MSVMDDVLVVYQRSLARSGLKLAEVAAQHDAARRELMALRERATAVERLAAWLAEDDHNEVDLFYMGPGRYSADPKNEPCGVWVALERPTLSQAIHDALDCFARRIEEAGGY